ncbi:hypothetical protein [Alteribacter keqinensis]|uniref:Uncharacterized protein n=1 Tax=Alteribacter keqinensis TaxID=2483800 RepID=A0A3M7TSL2_9BACI|nr:hypothetical protein [Alteribacter keqinensis]RNA68620.1 hypothetical protein EBO34_01225 [Alteribacter keqinensis]
MEYGFVAACFVFIVGFLALYSKVMGPVSREEAGREEFRKLQTAFFIRFAIMETPVIAIIVLVFILLEGQVGIDFIMPAAIIMVLTLVGIVFTFIMARGAWESRGGEKFRFSLHTFFFIGVALITAIPIVCVVLLYVLREQGVS